MDVSLVGWLALTGAILVMLAIDLFFHREPKPIAFKEAAAWSVLWVVIALVAGGVIGAIYGSEFWWQYLSGYLIEKSLAVDNVFIWALIFSYFAVPSRLQHRVLFYGVLGALVFRGVLIAAGSVLLASIWWMIYAFAIFLIFTGIKMLQHRNEELDIENSRALKFVNRFIPISTTYEGEKFFVRQNRKLTATPLFAVLLLVEIMDVVFAVDSIPAIFAVTEEPFIVFASNAFAILGLRAMYFLLSGLMDRFVYLKMGLAVIMLWV
ncbi:MAG: TerC/Alx family metal homeostasis membrane protein, partial [Actinobacteria bacterium]|nr:TerC/Alx family metal homeostasis membrane protein [Actinomycetota bacterium]